MIYGYARVSTKGQARDGNSLEAQEKELRENGATIIFKDSFTGTKTDRPELQKLLEIVGKGDTLVVTKLDRVARNVEGGIKLINELEEKGVKIHILNMGMLDDSTTGKLIRNILLSFAEFERDMIVQRCQEGKEIAKQNPDYKEGRPRVDEGKIEYAMVLIEKGYTITEVVKKSGVSRSTLMRYKRERKR